MSSVLITGLRSEEAAAGLRGEASGHLRAVQLDVTRGESVLPRERYLVGADARAQIALRVVLAQRALDATLARLFGSSRDAGA